MVVQTRSCFGRCETLVNLECQLLALSVAMMQVSSMYLHIMYHNVNAGHAHKGYDKVVIIVTPYTREKKRG